MTRGTFLKSLLGLTALPPLCERRVQENDELEFEYEFVLDFNTEGTNWVHHYDKETGTHSFILQSKVKLAQTPICNA